MTEKTDPETQEDEQDSDSSEQAPTNTESRIKKQKIGHSGITNKTTTAKTKLKKKNK